MVVTVAMDSEAAARPWFDAAKPTHVSLIDPDHHVAELYNMVNVPQAAWIDEAGRFVRPPETAGATDGFRGMNRETFAIPAEVAATRARVKERYNAAVRDWALKGQASEHALDAAGVKARLRLPDPAVAEAHTRFRLGQHLLSRNRHQEAALHMAEATRLHPDSWNMWRQTATKDARGLATGPQFWERVDALGDQPYYVPADMKGLV